MTEKHEKTRPKVENAIRAVRGALKESTISDGMKHGDISYDPVTGSAKTKHSTDALDIEVNISPKKETTP